MNRARKANKKRLLDLFRSNARFYGDGTTIHGTTHVDVETFRGTVVAVWYRCQMLRFDQHEVDGPRVTEMELDRGELPPLRGLILEDDTSA